MNTRVRLGALIYDLWPAAYSCLARRGSRRLPGWSQIRNRHESISVGARQEGIQCHWEHARDLHLTNVFPGLSPILLRRMLKDWPIEFKESPVTSHQSPEVSFVIGHRGTARLSHLMLTLKSIAAQVNVVFDCIVVEQSHEPELQDRLPAWVRYHHTKTPSPNYLYNRSWALNEGVRHAQGRIVILHDGDMLVPAEYAAEMLYQNQLGFDVINLKRFIAYLNEPSTSQIFTIGDLSGTLRSEHVVENLCAGGSLGISREQFWSLGGMDEEFVGWGGEDTEFWDRCQTLQVANHTYMPIVHLWHPSQPGKTAVNGMGEQTANYFTKRMKIHAKTRITQLSERISPNGTLMLDRANSDGMS